MKRKFLALLLAFVMVVGMLPVSAFAVPATDGEATVKVDGKPAGETAVVDDDGVHKYVADDTVASSLLFVKSGEGEGTNATTYGYWPSIDMPTPGNGDVYVLYREASAIESGLQDAIKEFAEGEQNSQSNGTTNADWYELVKGNALGTYWPTVRSYPTMNVIWAKAPEDAGNYTLVTYSFDFSNVSIDLPFDISGVTNADLKAAGVPEGELPETELSEGVAIDNTAKILLGTKEVKVNGTANQAAFPWFSATDNEGYFVAMKLDLNAEIKDDVRKVTFKLSDNTVKDLDEDGILIWKLDDNKTNATIPVTVVFQRDAGDATKDYSITYNLKLGAVKLSAPASTDVAQLSDPGFAANAEDAEKAMGIASDAPAGQKCDPDTMWVSVDKLKKNTAYTFTVTDANGEEVYTETIEEDTLSEDKANVHFYFTLNAELVSSKPANHSVALKAAASGEYTLSLKEGDNDPSVVKLTLNKVTLKESDSKSTEVFAAKGNTIQLPDVTPTDPATTEYKGWKVESAEDSTAAKTYVVNDDATLVPVFGDISQDTAIKSVAITMNEDPVDIGGELPEATVVVKGTDDTELSDAVTVTTTWEPADTSAAGDHVATFKVEAADGFTLTGATYTVNEDAATADDQGILDKTVTVNVKEAAPTIEVVPANLTTVDDQKPPMYGQAKVYTAVLDADTKTITVTATGLQKTENSEGTKAYWVGIGLTHQENATYATGWGDYDASKVTDDAFTAADNSQVVDGKTYDTMYWGAGSEKVNDFWTRDSSKTGYVAVKVGDAEPIVYTIKFNVDVATYKLTTSHTGEGTVTTDAEDANALYEDGVVTITATPGEGQKVATMTVNGEAVTGTTNAETGIVTYEVTIGKTDVAVAVSFVDKNAEVRNVTVADPMPDGIESITTVPSGTAFSGEPVTVTVTAKTGYEVTAVTYTYEVDSVKKTETVTGGSFIMPDADVTVTATAKATISAGFAWTAAQANEDRNTAAAKFDKHQGLNDGLDQTVWFMINTDIKGNHYWYEISDGTDVLWEGAMNYDEEATARGMISASFLHTNPNGDAHNKDGKTVPETLVVKVWKTAAAVTAKPDSDPFDSKTITTGDNPLKIDTVTTAIEDNTVTVKFNQDLFGRYVVELKKGSEVVSAETLECEAPTPAVAKETGYTFNNVAFEDGDYTVSVYQAACTEPTAATPNPVTGSAFASKSFTIGTVTVGDQSGKFNTAAGTTVKEVIEVTDPVAEAGQAFVGWVINDTDTPISTEDLNNTVLTGTVTYKAKFKEVTSTDILVTPFSGALDLGDMNGSDLQSGVKVEESADGKTFSFTGDSKYIFDWTEFSSVPAEQEGNFLAIKILPALANSGTIIKVGNTTLDETGIYVVILNGSNGYKNTVTVTAGDKTAEYTLDFTNVDRLPGTITAVAKKTGDAAINVAFQNGTIVLSGVVADDEALKGLVLNVTCNDVVKGITVTLTKDAENNTITATADPAVLAGNTFTFDTSMLAVKNENAAEHATVAPPQAAVSEDIPADQQEAAEAISNALAVTDDDGNTVTKVDESVLQKYADVEANNAEAKDTLLSGADAIVKDTANADKVPDALKTAIADAADENATDAQKNAVTTVVQVYTKIEVTGVETAAGGSVTGFTVSITPMAQTVVTTVSKTDLENGTDTITTFDPAKDTAANAGANAIVVDEKPIPVSEPTVVTLALPEGAFADSTVYILHEKDTGHRYVYDGTVVKNVLTFTSTHGFSNFTITNADPTVAKTGGVNYASLKEAVDEVANNGTITLMTDCAENVTVSKEIVFALELNGHLFTGKFEAGTGYTMAKDEESNTYTFTKVVVDNTVAMIGEDKYDSLTAAVEAVTNNGTIKLMKDCDETVTVSKEIAFTLELDGHKFTGKFEAGTGYTMAKDEVSNTYTFTKVVDNTVAKIGDIEYNSLDAAVKAVANNGTITLMKDCDETVTVSKEIAFTLELDGHKFTGKFEAGTGYTMAKDEESNTYTFTKVVVDDTVAKIGDTTYKSLADAVANVKNDETITLVADVTLTEDITVNRVVKFTVDLNGHTITGGAIVAYDGYKNDSTTANEYNFVSTGGENPPSTGGGSGGGSASYAISVPANVANGKISVNPDRASEGTKVTITVTPDEGYKVGTVTVTDKNGNKINVTDAGGNKYTFTMPKSKVDVNVTFVSEDAKFLDVPADSYYAAAVDWAVAKGITQGTSETMFSPNKACTRAEVVTFLWRAAGSPKSTGANPFTDVAEGAYYYDAVLWAVEKGITVGTTETTFSPDTVCSRSEIVTFLWRYEETPEAEASSFDDVKADDWFYNAVNWAVSEEITVGTGANAFSPAVNCTRAEVVTFLFRDMA